MACRAVPCLSWEIVTNKFPFPVQQCVSLWRDLSSKRPWLVGDYYWTKKPISYFLVARHIFMMRNSSDMISVTPHGTVFLLDNVEVKTCRPPRVTGPADFRIGSVVKVSRTRGGEGGRWGGTHCIASQSILRAAIILSPVRHLQHGQEKEENLFPSLY